MALACVVVVEYLFEFLVCKYTCLRHLVHQMLLFVKHSMFSDVLFEQAEMVFVLYLSTSSTYAVM
ncbi:hypothetical protein BA900_07190 [Spiribacter roseus]|nr:hypothetical protein BA900_07190 [Spiribacter roseus]